MTTELKPKFTFVHKDERELLYLATLINDDIGYRVTWVEGGIPASCTYQTEVVVKYIKDGTWLPTKDGFNLDIPTKS